MWAFNEIHEIKQSGLLTFGLKRSAGRLRKLVAQFDTEVLDPRHKLHDEIHDLLRPSGQ